MFSYLSRGYGTYEGIAKLEKPDSAQGRDCYNVFPPINKDSNNFYRRHFDYDGMYRIPQEQLKLPEMPKSSLNMPKTYTTKSGALLLYSEGCFVPGSRRLKKRPRFSRPKEKKIESIKDFMELIMKYKKNGCDPLFLEQLWRRASARDVQPGYSPNRYLGHLSRTTFDVESWKKLLETGSLKSFGTGDESFLPSLLPEYSEHLRDRPQPYKTMSLPPVSPSNSMVASFTFYQNAMSTGAASMVSLPSVNSENVEEQLSAKTNATAEALSARLAEVKSESGFKRDYDSLTVKEKEDLLTQLLMDVTLQNQGEVITVPTQDSSSTVDPNVSFGSNASKSPSSYRSMFSEASDKMKSVMKETKSSASVQSSRSGQKPTSAVSSPTDHTRSVCSLPPIVSKENNLDENGSWKPSLSSSGSGLSLVSGDLAIGLNSFDIESDDDSLLLGSDVNLEKQNIETRSLTSEKAFSEHSLVDALDIQDAESLHHLTDEDTRSLKSLGSAGVSRIKPIMSDNAIDEKTGVVLISSTDQVEDNLVVRGDGDIASESDGRSIGELGKDGVYDGTESGSNGDLDKTSIRCTDNGENDDLTIGIGGNDYDGYMNGDTKEFDPHVLQTIPTIDVVPSTGELPHMSLTSLQDEVRLVASEVLSRPKSGRVLAEDAHMAKFLLMQRIKGLLAPVVCVRNVRASSAASSALGALARSRNSEMLGIRRIRSAEARSLSRKPEEIQVEPVSGEETKQVKHVAGKDGRQVEEISGNEGKQVEQVVGEEEKQVKQVSSIDGEQVGQTTDDEQTLVFGVGKQILSVEEQQVACEKGTPFEQVSSDKSEQVKLVASEEKEQGTEVDTVNETEVCVETEAIPFHDTQVQSPHVSSAASSPVDELLLTIKDLKPENVQDEEKKGEGAMVEEGKEIKQKISRVKKETKRGSLAKGKKKKPVARARIEPAKTPPFRAGLVPEAKPPTGLEEKTRKARKGESDREASPDLQDEKSFEVSKDLASPGIPGRIDSETGEVKHRTPSGKTPSLTSRSPQSEERSSREDVASSRLESEFTHETSSSTHDGTLSPRDKTLSPRDKTSSPRDHKTCTRDAMQHDKDVHQNVNRNVTMESVETAGGQPSPEVVLTEKERRARARAAQRAAAAERRRQEVERKRREREEARRRAQEEEERLEVLRKEAEEEMKRREEERRVQREAEERERMRVEAEQNERARQERLMIERQRQAREERQRKKEQLVAQRKFEEELRAERERIELQIEEERRREYEENIAHLAEEEQSRLLEERRLEEERIKREIQEEKERREEERRRMLEERQRMEEELAAAKQRQLARRNFLETLLRDFQNLLLDQRVSPAFTFSYFDIMPWFKDRWRELEEARPCSKRPSTQLETVPEESELDLFGEIL